jgi:hypothetical protein
VTASTLLRRLAPANRQNLAAILEAGPWCWPLDAVDVAEREALSGSSFPLMPAVGTAVGVSVSSDHSRATLWLLDTRPGANPDATLDRSGDETWEAAALALPRAIPLLWSSLHAARARRPALRWVGTWASSGVAPSHEGSVTGTSFGLTFVLLLASRLVGLPLRGDLACSAAIDAAGRVMPIGGLAAKVEALLEFAPRVQRVLVAASQMDDAITILASRGVESARLQAVPVKSVGDALQIVFGEGLLAETLDRSGRDEAKRSELTRSFFRLALQGRGEFVDWTPIERAARRAAEWQDLDASQRYMLEFAEGIAARHERNQGDLALPTSGFLHSWPRRIRYQVLPHIVQQAADTGRPSPEDVRHFCEPFRARSLRDGFLPELKLEGALARLDAVTGHPERSLQTQFELARVYLDSFLPDEVSFPLSECYRLSGLLCDATSFDRAESLRTEATAAGGLGFVGSPYVGLARARAQLLLGPTDCEEARDTLVRLAGDARLAAHVRWAGARWLHRCPSEKATSDLHAADAALAAAARDTDSRKAHAATVQTALIQLDLSLDRSDPPGAERALAMLQEKEPGLIGLLAGWAPTGEVPSHVARYYPY